jgi:hypothetical protein
MESEIARMLRRPAGGFHLATDLLKIAPEGKVRREYLPPEFGLGQAENGSGLRFQTEQPHLSGEELSLNWRTSADLPWYARINDPNFLIATIFRF